MSNRFPFLSSLISITLILFFLGVFILVGLTGKIAVDAAREDLDFQVYLTESTKPEAAAKLMESWRVLPFVRKIEYRSKTQALREAQGLDSEFLEAMDSINPYMASINIRLMNEYIDADSIRAISKQLKVYPEVYEFNYPINLIENVNRRAAVSLQVVLVVTLILAGIVSLLIMNTIRLAIFSRRMNIRIMQLVGATNSYIRRPFLRLGMLQGLVGGLAADCLLFGLLLFFSRQVVNIEPIIESAEVWALYIGLVIFGAAIGWLSSWIAVNGILNKKLAEII